MRRMEVIATALLWVAVATLMPMAALEPVQAPYAPATAVVAGLR